MLTPMAGEWTTVHAATDLFKAKSTKAPDAPTEVLVKLTVT